ncbi:hypothetical protein ACHAXT_011631 [Thalassiosira profunda]
MASQHDGLYDDGRPDTPTSSPPPSAAGTPKSPKAKSMPVSSLFKSMKTHLNVVKSAIAPAGGRHSPLIKTGDLYPWDGGPATPQPARKESAGSLRNIDPSMTGGSAATLKMTTKRRRQPPPLDAGATAETVLDALSKQPPAGSPRHLAQQRKFYMTDNSSPGNQSAASSLKADQQSTWSWSERLFLSQDDEEVTVGNSFDTNSRSPTPVQQNSFASVKPVASVKFAPTLDAPDEEDDDDATCNNTVVEKVRQRGKKASRASTVGAFVTFLKALFGIGMLSNPAVLGEVGLLLGTFCHLFIVVGCAFACYLLLTARQMAKTEVLANQRRDQEKRETYAMWRAEMETRAAQRAGRGQVTEAVVSKDYNRDISAMTANTNPEGSDSSRRGSDNSSQRTLKAVNSGEVSEWTAAPVPIPLARVGTSMIKPPKEGWGRCEDALQTAVFKTSNEKEAPAVSTMSCGNVQMMKSTSKSKSLNKLDSSTRSPNRSSTPVTDAYQRLSDRIHTEMLPALPEPPLPPETTKDVRLVTYGDVAKYLAGARASFFIVFTIVTVHLMFASGMVHLAVENLCYVVGWERLGWSYVEEYVEEDDDRRAMMRRLSGSQSEDERHSRSSDEEEYYLEWKGPDFVGRLAMASLLFPIIHYLLQIPSLTELATISTVGLLTYAIGCIGSMLYTAIVLTEGHPFLDHPDDMWVTKWSGIPTYVATTIYCIEGINLALPTVSSIEGAQRWGGVGLTQSGKSETGDKKRDKQDLSVFIVVGAVFLYGMVTLVVSWIGLAGGLGGGTGTMHGVDGCWDITYCLNSSAVRFVYMLSLGVALILTLPVILYPSTEMLEVWLDERNDERRRRIEAAMGQQEKSSRAFWQNQESLVPDDETMYTVRDKHTARSLGIQQTDIEMTELASPANTTGGYVPPNVNQPPTLMTVKTDTAPEEAVFSPLSAGPEYAAPENTKLKAKRKLKYWKLRMFLAFIICFVGTIEGSFPGALKAAEVIRGVGLSIAGLIFPPLLYMSAVGGNFSVPMAAAMALLIGLGFFNIVLVLLSAFGSTDYIVEEGRGNFYDL